MALLATLNIDGGVEVKAAYVRVTDCSIFSNNGSPKEWKLVYDVEVYKDADARVAGLKCPCGSVQHFKCDYDIETGGNPIAAAYVDLKARLESPVDC